MTRYAEHFKTMKLEALLSHIEAAGANGRFRKHRGATLAEGVVAISLLLLVFLGGCIFLLGVGAAVYYKVKIAHAAQLVARQLVQANTGNFLGGVYPNGPSLNVQQQARSACSTLFTRIGLPSPTVTARTQTINNKTYLIMTVQVNPLRIFGANFLTNSIPMSDVVTAVYPAQTPVAVGGITFNIIGVAGGGRGIYLPSYGEGTASSGGTYQGPTAIPVGRFPYWQTTVDGIMGQAFQDHSGGGDFSQYSL